MHIPAARQLLLSQEMASRYSALCHSAISTAAEIPGALAVLQHLVARGVSLFVSSATPVEPLRELISARGWQGIFRNVYGSPAAKAAHVRQILREGQWRPQELVYVGDSDVDAVAARETGCCFIAVCLDRASGRFAARPVNCIGTLLELPEMIGRLPLQAP
jgi:phosphoglycolate phosphatase